MCEDDIIGVKLLAIFPIDILAKMPGNGRHPGLFIHDHTAVFECGNLSRQFRVEVSIRINFC